MGVQVTTVNGGGGACCSQPDVHMCDWVFPGRVASIGPAGVEMSAPHYHKNT